MGGIAVADLKEEYTDTGDRTHRVEHILMPAEDKTDRERIVEELFQTLTRTGKKKPS